DQLLQKFNTPYEAFPFNAVSEKDYEPAITALLLEAKAEINRIASSPEPPTFANTVAALEYSGKPMSRVTEAFFNLNSAETSDYLQELAQKIAPQLAGFSNDILLNPSLFQRIKTVYDQKENLLLD